MALENKYASPEAVAEEGAENSRRRWNEVIALAAGMSLALAGCVLVVWRFFMLMQFRLMGEYPLSQVLFLISFCMAVYGTQMLGMTLSLAGARQIRFGRGLMLAGLVPYAVFCAAFWWNTSDRVPEMWILPCVGIGCLAWLGFLTLVAHRVGSRWMVGMACLTLMAFASAWAGTSVVWYFYYNMPWDGGPGYSELLSWLIFSSTWISPAVVFLFKACFATYFVLLIGLTFRLWRLAQILKEEP